MRALFVDDELEFLELMQKRLVRRGMEVATAPDGQTALNMVDEALAPGGEPFNIVVMDVRMPGMDGLETLRHMKQKAPKLPVLLLTGHACMGVAVEGLDLGDVRNADAADHAVGRQDRELVRRVEEQHEQEVERGVLLGGRGAPLVALRSTVRRDQAAAAGVPR